MKYLLLTYLDEKAWDALGPAQRERLMAECKPYVRELISSGKFLGGAPLHPTSAGKTVRARDGKRLITDGPFAETKEQLGGYTLIEAADLDEAIQVAEGLLGSSGVSAMEVRQVAELPDIPAH